VSSSSLKRSIGTLIIEVGSVTTITKATKKMMRTDMVMEVSVSAAKLSEIRTP
jgi:hypothetical protein